MSFSQRASFYLFLVLIAFCLALPTYIEHSQNAEKKSLHEGNDPVKNESFFKDIKYYSLKNNQKFQLDAENLTVNRRTSRTVFFSPLGKSLTASGKEVTYRAKRGEYIQNEMYLQLNGDVKIITEDSEVNGDDIKYYGQNDLIRAKGNVFSKSLSKKTNDQVEVEAQFVEVDTKRNLSSFKGSVKGLVKRKRAYEQNVEFGAEKMQLDRNIHKIDLQEEVSFKKRGLVAFSRSGEIFLENYNKKLKYFVLNDDVRVIEKVQMANKKPAKSFERKAFSEKLEGLMSEAKIILTGYPKVIQQGDTIKGNLIVLREDIDVIEVIDANTNFKVGN